MNIKGLYLMLTTWHMRLPYWFIATTIAAFVALFVILLVIWIKKEQYYRLYKTANSNLKKSKDDMSDIASKCKVKEEEIEKLNKAITTDRNQIREKESLIKDLNRKNAIQEASINEHKNQYRIYHSERTNLLSELQTKKETIENLKKSIVLAEEEIKKIEKEKKTLAKQLKNTQDTLNLRIDQFNILEEKCNQAESRNEVLENSRKLLEEEYEGLKVAIAEQANAYKTEITNLNLNIKIGNEKLEKTSKVLAETQKELQTVRDEKSLIEEDLQEILYKQKERERNILDRSKRLIENFAKW